MMDIAWAAFGISCISWIVVLFSIQAWVDKNGRSAGWVALGSLVLSIVLTVVWLWIWRGFFHALWFYVFYANAGLWLGWLMATVGAILILIVLYLISRAFKASHNTATAVGGIFGVMFLFIAIIGWGITYAALNTGWERSAMYDSLVYTELSEPRQTTSIRYLPQDVAFTYANNRIQESAIKIGKADPMVLDNEFVWQVVRKPNGFWNKQKGNSDGFGLVDDQGNVTWTRDEMKYGEGMYASDSLMWKLHEKRYWSKITDVYYAQGYEGEVVAVAPYLDYSFKFPVMVPHLGGVLLTYSNGNIEDVKPDQFANHPILQGIRILPKELAKKYVEAYTTKHGLNNYYFRHKDQVDLADSGSHFYWGEEMPYLLASKSGQDWFVAGVPWGSNGSHRFFYIDAITGDISLYSVNSDTGFLGPRKALDYVRANYPQLDVTGDIAVFEPRPIFRGNEFYWMYTLTTSWHYAGVVDTVLINARTSEMLSFGNKKETLDRFLAGEDTGRIITIHDTFNALEEPK